MCYYAAESTCVDMSCTGIDLYVDLHVHVGNECGAFDDSFVDQAT